MSVTVEVRGLFLLQEPPRLAAPGELFKARLEGVFKRGQSMEGVSALRFVLLQNKLRVRIGKSPALLETSLKNEIISKLRRSPANAKIFYLEKFTIWIPSA